MNRVRNIVTDRINGTPEDVPLPPQHCHRNRHEAVVYSGGFDAFLLLLLKLKSLKYTILLLLLYY